MYVGGISREYIFAFPFPVFPFNRDKIHEFTITRNVYLLAGWLQTSLQSWQYIFFPGGVRIFLVLPPW